LTTQATLVHTAQALGISPANLSLLMQPLQPVDVAAGHYGVSLPWDLIGNMGAVPTADGMTTPGQTAVRTTILKWGFGTTPTATVTVDATGAVTAVAVGLAGTGMAGPPVVTITGNVGAASKAAVIVPKMQVRGGTVLQAGANYTKNPTVVFVGGLAPGGVAATGTVSTGGNAVTGINITTAGGPYLTPPLAVIVDGATGLGFGAVVAVDLSIASYSVAYAGQGYPATGAGINFAPIFKLSFPDAGGTAAQGAPFANLIKTALELSCCCPIVADTPVVV
jgi:hypothetical protein